MRKLGLLLLLYSSVAFAAPEMSVSPQNPVEGGQMQIIFSDDKPIKALPDLSSLNQNFMVRGQSQSSNVSIVNGVASQHYQVSLSVFPKSAGTFEIGPFDVNQTQIPAQTVVVGKGAPAALSPAPAVGLNNGMNLNGGQPLNAAENPQGQGIFQLTSQIEPQEMYIGESALYTVRMEENIGITQAQIIVPEVQNASLTQYGEDKIGRSTAQNQAVRVLERSFTFTPKQAGEYALEPAQVIAMIPDRSHKSVRRGFPDFFGQDPFFEMAVGLPQKEIYQQSEPIRITVLDKPADWKGWWLPAREVRLTDEYIEKGTLKAGTPIERKVRLQALGVEGHQLPLLTQASADNLKAYANPDQRGEIALTDGLWGYEEITFVLVPLKEGEITVPEIKVAWFNTRSKQKEVAVLPARTFYVAEQDGTFGGVVKADSPTPPEQKTPDIPPQENNVPDKSPDLPVQKADLTQNESLKTLFLLNWPLLLGALAMIIAVAAGVFGVIKYRRRKQKSVALQIAKEAENKARYKKKPLPDLYPF